jgi:hypothetical protein
LPEHIDIDPLDLCGRLGRIHHLRVEGPNLFRHVDCGAIPARVMRDLGIGW